MKWISYIILRFFIGFLKIIPFSVLYVLSDGIAFLLENVVKYRKKVVIANLKKAFPQKTDNEIKQICKLSYRNLADIILETIKGFSMPPHQIIERHKILNPELPKQFLNQGKSVMLTASHYCNWEWGAGSFAKQINFSVVGLYKPIANPIIDKYIRNLRISWGVNMLSIKKTARVFEEYASTPTMFGLVGDQSPSNVNKSHWINFLGIETACLHGPEKYAKQYNMPVIYGHIKRVKRGFYEIHFKLLTETPKSTKDSEITEMAMRELETVLLHTPENWLWSHKRWKHSKN